MFKGVCGCGRETFIKGGYKFYAMTQPCFFAFSHDEGRLADMLLDTGCSSNDVFWPAWPTELIRSSCLSR